MRIRWKPWQDAKIAALWAAGASLPVIADEVYASVEAVTARRKALGIPDRVAPRPPRNGDFSYMVAPGPRVRERKCIRCRHGFTSQHPGHRMCDLCRMRPAEPDYSLDGQPGARVSF